MLKWTLAIGALVLLLAPMAAPAAAAGAPTPPDSFLWTRVSSPEQFIRQVEENPTIRARFAKHFHVSQAELVSYLRDNLVVVTIQASGRYPVYGVTRTGRIYKSSSYFKQGYRAYGLRNGTVLFKWACGNPMVTQLPKEQVAALTQVEPEKPAPLAPPVEEATVMPAPDTPQMVVAMAHEWGYPAVAQTPGGPVYQASALAQSSRRFPAWLLGAPLLIPHDHDEPVPEPGSLLLLGAGLSALLGASLRRRR